MEGLPSILDRRKTYQILRSILKVFGPTFFKRLASRGQRPRLPLGTRCALSLADGEISTIQKR